MFPTTKSLSIYILALILLTSWGCNTTSQSSQKLSDDAQRLAENALVGLEVAEGLQATLFASEPMLVNPTNIDIDAKGRIWVCEGYNYRMHLNPGNPQNDEGDRILILEDTDGDGKADSKKVFYQGNDVNAALGIAVLGDKIIVSCSPNVFIFTDADGDDKPDNKEVFFTGMKGVQHDHGMHAFVFGPDGKLYFNYGNEGNQLLDGNEQPLTDKFGNIVNAEGKPYRQGMVFRCNPDGSELEVLAHNFRNNYEVAVDAFGTLWQSDNDDDGNKAVRINYVMEYGNYGFKDEMTGAGWRAKRTGMHEEIPKRHWHLNDPGSVPNLLQTGAGSPTGMIIYEGDLLPAVFHNQMIHCDAGPNVVRAYPVQPDGAGYSGEIVNILKGNKDQWFRPSDVCVGPDGSIFVADWYDPGVGGHQAGDLDRGRIYRIAPPKTPYEFADLDVSTVEGAIEALKSPNMARRYLGWTSLHEMGADAEDALKALINDENPRFQARAYWLLAKMDEKGANYVQEAMQSANPNLRIQALRMARQVDAANLANYVQQVVRDDSPQVLREAAITLRDMNPDEIAPLWAELAIQYDGKDRWYLEALGIGAMPNWDACFAAWQAKVGNEWRSPAGQDIIWRSRAKASLPLLKALITNPNMTEDAMLRYFRAFDFQSGSERDQVVGSLLSVTGKNQDFIAATALRHLSVDYIQGSPLARKVLDKTIASLSGTPAYIDLVEKLNLESEQDELFAVMQTDPNGQLGLDAARLILKFGGTERFTNAIYGDDPQAQKATLTAVGNIRNWEAMKYLEGVVLDENLDMNIRKQAVTAMGQGWHGENRALKMLEENELPEELIAPAATALMRAGRDTYREKAAAYLDIPVSDQATFASISELAKREGDITAGKTVFATNCSNCHQVNGEGIQFGPDLSEIGDKLPKEGLYASILQPSAGINFGYEGYTFTTKDGNIVSGYVESETAEEISIRMIGGLTQKHLISNIDKREPMEQSLMTPNLHLLIGEEALVDLVEYLGSLRKGDGVAMR